VRKEKGASRKGEHEKSTSVCDDIGVRNGTTGSGKKDRPTRSRNHHHPKEKENPGVQHTNKWRKRHSVRRLPVKRPFLYSFRGLLEIAHASDSEKKTSRKKSIFEWVVYPGVSKARSGEIKERKSTTK